MHITCAICAELFGNADVDKISILRCGHIFHAACVKEWFKRFVKHQQCRQTDHELTINLILLFSCNKSKTCPQCRRPDETIIRAYFNVQNINDTSQAEGSAEQQKTIDDLRYQLLEKDGALKRKSDEISILSGEVNKLKESQRKSRVTIIGLEQIRDQNKILCETHCHQVICLSLSLSHPQYSNINIFPDYISGTACKRN